MSHHRLPSLVLPRLRPSRRPNLVTIILLSCLYWDTDYVICVLTAYLYCVMKFSFYWKCLCFSQPAQPWWKASLLLLVWKSSSMRWSISNDQERWFQIIGLMDFVSRKKWNEIKFRTELNNNYSLTVHCLKTAGKRINLVMELEVLFDLTDTRPDQTRADQRPQGRQLELMIQFLSQLPSQSPVSTWPADLDTIFRQNGFLFEL